ncbi:isopenicillin N synthase family dioxygenase [Tunicatimonas pelagia]|uniref:isopenicillin N synthase family dioxygenase n=1 Tax=Tunicatimonas pelagia TaxID=931531 RepID=UPI002666A4F0|nr:2-oxoglutarate and iron-dependent oxygenase domain-containing protein [Tunicatimonas pelagia]WKN40690.1 2-oxoglutarate and iron-dependent oxygenase domain-containing protein [Tunicatimonas pelagia]
MADLFDAIPSLDLHQFTQGNTAQKAQFVDQLGDAFHRIGFVAIKNHGLTDELTEKLYTTVKEFFALPEEVKKQCDRPELHGQRGYTSKGKEHAKGRTTADLKEFYQIGQFVDDGDPIKENYPDNIWPEAEVPNMHSTAKETYQTLEAAGKQLLRAIALYLNLEENYFDQHVHNGNSILRAIHYYPIKNPEAVPDDAVRAAEHGDINLITLLMGASADGLQVLRRDGAWIPITALPDQIIVNVGDMLARLTNDTLKSTIHRVVNPPRELLGMPRYSIPFFMHPRADMDLTCLDSCVSEDQPKQYEDMTAGAFLEERLREIGLKQ